MLPLLLLSWPRFLIRPMHFFTSIFISFDKCFIRICYFIASSCFSGWVLKWNRGLCWCLLVICFANGWISRLNVGADRMFCHTIQIKLLLIQTNPFVNCRTWCSDGSHVNYLYKCGEFHVKSTNQMYKTSDMYNSIFEICKAMVFKWIKLDNVTAHVTTGRVNNWMTLKKKSATKLIWLCCLMWSLVHVYFTFRAKYDSVYFEVISSAPFKGSLRCSIRIEFNVWTNLVAW